MVNKYFKEASDSLAKLGINALDDIIIASQSKVILFSDITDAVPRLNVISGNLSYFGLEDKKSIALEDFVGLLDLDNKYAEVSGREEYFKTIYDDIFDFTTDTNITIPLSINGNRLWVRFHVVDIETSENVKAFFITNVTEYRQDEEEMFEKTHKDSLTHLFNKYTLDYHYGARFRFDDFHVMYLDLDDFKKINDKCGHIVGNDFLVEFANILKSHEDNYNRFYRIGGDEFVGFLFKKENEVVSIATDILLRTTKYKHPDCKHSISTSIGICKSTIGEDVIRKADKVLYEVKENGKNHFSYKTEDEIKIGE